jgi:hypothetical protein
MERIEEVREVHTSTPAPSSEAPTSEVALLIFFMNNHSYIFPS